MFVIIFNKLTLIDMKTNIFQKNGSIKLLTGILFLATVQIQAQTYQEVAKRTAFDPIASLSDREINNRYGTAVDADGDFAVVGAYNKEIVSGGTTYTEAGAVYVLEKVSGTWQTVQKLVANDPETGAHFGQSVAIHDGYIIVGAPLGEHSTGGGQDHGTAYIFEYNGTTWSQTVKLESPSSNPGNKVFFGNSVDIYNNVGTSSTEVFAVIGEPRSYPHGKAFVYKRISSNNWQNVSTLTDGTAPVAGKNQYFGQSVAIHKDYLVVGAINGFVVGASPAYGGLSYVFHYNGTDWTTTPEFRLVAGDQAEWDRFGSDVDITDDYVIVGAPAEKSPNSPANVSIGSGAAYIFERTALNDWTQIDKLVTLQRNGSESYGSSVSITSDFALVGAANDRFDYCGTVINQTGTAYLYANDDPFSTYRLVEQLRASDAQISDQFGAEVAISGTASDPSFFVGASLEDHDNNGNNLIDNSGSMYIYEKPSSTARTKNPLSNGAEQSLIDEIEVDLYNLDDELQGHSFVGSKEDIKFQLIKSDNLLTVQMEEELINQNERMTIKMIDAKGQLLYRRDVNSSNSVVIESDGLAKGVYFISIVSEKSRSTKKILLD